MTNRIRIAYAAAITTTMLALTAGNAIAQDIIPDPERSERGVLAFVGELLARLSDFL